MEKIKQALNPGADKDDKILYGSGEAESADQHKGQVAGEGSHFARDDDVGPHGEAAHDHGPSHGREYANNPVATQHTSSHPTQATDEISSTPAHHATPGEPKGDAPKAWGTHEGLEFGKRWDPAADIASNVRRSQIMAIASSRAEKGSQDELLPDRRSSIAKAEQDRKFSESYGKRGSRDIEDRIVALAHSRSERGQQTELHPHENSSIEQTERDRQHSLSHPTDDIDARIRALASSRSEKGSQGALTPDRRSSMALADENRKFSLSHPAESPRKNSVTPFVVEERRQEARKASLSGMSSDAVEQLGSKESSRRASVAAGIAAFGAGTGHGHSHLNEAQTAASSQDPTPHPVKHSGLTHEVKVESSQGHQGEEAAVASGAVAAGGGLAGHQTHPIGGTTQERVPVQSGQDRQVVETQDHHVGRDVAAAGGAAAVGGAAAYGVERETDRKQREREEKELEKQRKKEAKEREEAEKKHEKEQKEAEKKAKKEQEEAAKKAKKDQEEAEKKAKKQREEAEKQAKKEREKAEAAAAAEKQAQKDREKAEASAVEQQRRKEQEAEEQLRKAEKEREEQEKQEARRRHEKEAATAAIGAGAVGAGAYEYEKHHDNAATTSETTPMTQPTQTTASTTATTQASAAPAPSSQAFHANDQVDPRVDARAGPGAAAYYGQTDSAQATGDNEHHRAAEATAGAAAAGVAGATAYEVDKHHEVSEANDRARRPSQDRQAEKREQKDEQKEKRSSFLGGLFSRKDKDKDNENEDRERKKEERREEKDTRDHGNRQEALVKEERKEEKREEKEHAKLVKQERKEERKEAEEERRDGADLVNDGPPKVADDEAGHTKLHKEPPPAVQQQQHDIAHQQIVTDPTTGLPKDLAKAIPGSHGTDQLPSRG